MFGPEEFNEEILGCVIGGESAVDLRSLHLDTIEKAHRFLKTYGYDLEEAEDRDRLVALFLRAITYLKENYQAEVGAPPSEVSDIQKLGDPSQLIVYCSLPRDQVDRAVRRWSCATLRAMHVISHIEHDLFFTFSDLIQEQVLANFRPHLIQDPIMGTVLGGTSRADQIPIKRFDVKPFKATDSAVTKFLSKPQAVAISIYDKMGVRFVSRNIFEAFRVVRYLVAEELVSFPNILPDQSKNTLYPVNLLLETLAETKGMLDSDEIEKQLEQKLQTDSHRALFRDRENEFSADDYRVIKFISRQLIRLPIDGRTSRFFFPYEVQIMDYDTHARTLKGPTSHMAYKLRQKEAAKARLFSEA
ncbi:MAG: TIGR04552 family protein [Bdellovibrionales bacterium CG10_big_fil_rev_8_21_14_0_10_45_34]|nr:MAG: TIGR04552 family protein [Bdellovibrionales bacterium CG10_big_fil_rev_8_21_14_0_10_45_34]